MNLKSATTENLEEIYSLVQKTIQTTYSKYYAYGVVEFFKNHHSKENILADINAGRIYVIEENEKIIATGTISGNHITRVFVKPEFQGKGYGTFILNNFETLILANHSSVEVDASLAAAKMYENRGYKTIRHETIDCENDAILVYEVMEKVR